jgi:site-specific DNA recombinase
MKTAFQYARISDEDQSNFSISGQLMDNENWARKNKVLIVDTFIDDGYSAKDFNRPAWKKLAARLKKQKVDYLIITKYDRLIRNASEGLSFQKELLQKWGVTLLSVQENYNIDINDPYAFKIQATMFVDAEFERLRIADRTKFGVWSAMSQGRFIGHAPFGYDNKRDPDDKPIITVNELEKPLVQKIFNDFISGVPISVIFKNAKEEGFRLRGKESIKRLLINPVYAGLIKVNAYKHNVEKFCPGIHEPIITESVFWNAFYEVQDMNRPIVKVLNEFLPLRGFLRCDRCDHPHTGSRCRGRNQYYYYYWCEKCKGETFSAIKTHNIVEQILNGLSLKKEVVEDIKTEIEIDMQGSIKNNKLKLAEVENKRSSLIKGIESLEKKFIENDIDKTTYAKWKLKYGAEMNEVNAEINKLMGVSSEYTKLLKKHIDRFCNLYSLYSACSIEDKHLFMRSIFPFGLSLVKGATRTTFIPDLFHMNALSINSLLQFKEKGESPISGQFPIGTRGGT